MVDQRDFQMRNGSVESGITGMEGPGQQGQGAEGRDSQNRAIPTSKAGSEHDG